jgi:hypothetical protein
VKVGTGAGLHAMELYIGTAHFFTKATKWVCPVLIESSQAIFNRPSLIAKERLHDGTENRLGSATTMLLFSHLDMFTYLSVSSGPLVLEMQRKLPTTL